MIAIHFCVCGTLLSRLVLLRGVFFPAVYETNQDVVVQLTIQTESVEHDVTDGFQGIDENCQ